VAVRSSRTDHGEHRTDQLITERLDPGLPLQARGLSSSDIAAGGLAVHPRALRDLPQPNPSEPPPEHLSHLNHTDLPESHAR